MRDEFNAPCDTHDDSRTLRRMPSDASIATIRLSNNKGIRRCISDIAENLLKQMDAKKRNKSSPTQDIPTNLNTVHGQASDSKKTTHGQKTTPLQDLSRNSETKSTLEILDGLHGGGPFERNIVPVFLSCESDLLVDVSLPKDEEDCTVPDNSLGMRLPTKWPSTTMCLGPPRIGIKDVQFNIQPLESDVTIWDGLQVEDHYFRCRLFLRCTTLPYDSVCIPDVDRIEMNCHTHPTRSRYARQPALQATYRDTGLGGTTISKGVSKTNLAAGIHVDKFWRTAMNDDSTWGWYKDAFVPLSPRLFDKFDYREFKLVGRAWAGESCVESELVFGISMLFRGVEMS